MPPLLPVLPSSNANPSGSDMPSDLLSLCGNQVLWWFARFAATFDKGYVPRSYDSMVGLSS
jgi:hypothetical protein